MTFDLHQLFGIVLHLVFLLGVMVFLLRVILPVLWEDVRPGATLELDHHVSRGLIRGAGPVGVFRLLVALGFLTTIAVTARWMLAGHLVPELADLQRRYDKRPSSLERVYRKGAIVDHVGRVIVEPDTGTTRGIDKAASFCHVVGYDGPMIGRSGVAGACRERLLGRTFGTFEEAATFTRNIFFRREQRGATVRVTLDRELQRTAATALAERRGAVVALDVATGGVLVMVSSPGYHEDDVPRLLKAQGETSTAPLLNRATQGRYPPGSLLKVMTAAAALEAGLSPEYSSPGGGYLPPGSNLPVRDHEALEDSGWTGRGKIGLTEALVHSSNTYFARLGVELGWERLFQTAMHWGFHEQFTLFEDDAQNRSLQIAASSFPPDMGQVPADVARVAIGQHRILTTPLHMALVYAAIANDGVLVQPRILAETPVRRVGRILRPQTARRLRQALRQVVVDGTGRHAQGTEVAVAGKTGTAENPRGDGHAWFAGFAPAEQPRLCVLVLVENGGYGGKVAAPIAREIIDKAARQGIR